MGEIIFIVHKIKIGYIVIDISLNSNVSYGYKYYSFTIFMIVITDNWLPVFITLIQQKKMDCDYFPEKKIIVLITKRHIKITAAFWFCVKFVILLNSKIYQVVNKSQM